VIGLGNPGEKYENTRHNIGFCVVDQLHESLNGSEWSLKTDMESSVSETRVGDTKVVLVKPQTFMNLSGRAVSRIAHYYRIDPAEIFVVYDDADLPVGTIRIRLTGGSGGHNGIQSIIDALGTELFPHFRIGVSSPEREARAVETKDFVLSTFTNAEQEHVATSITDMTHALQLAVTEGIEVAMNQWNKNDK